jgi:hypothetical protein
MVVVRTSVRKIGSEPTLRNGQRVPEVSCGDKGLAARRKPIFSIGETGQPALPAADYDPGRFCGLGPDRSQPPGMATPKRKERILCTGELFPFSRR